GAESQLRPASVVHGEPYKPQQCEGKLVRLGGSQARWHCTEQLAVRFWRLGLAVGTAKGAVLPAQFPREPARPQLPRAGGGPANARGGKVLAGAWCRRVA